jgi:hypothetical protein
MKKRILFGMAIFIATIGNAATLTVTNTNDSGAGSLRQALSDANNGDTINFSVTGVITVSSLLDISKDVVIEGPGADILAIDGNSSTTVFKDQNYAINTVVISGLEIRNGSSGAYGAGIGGLGYNLTVKYCNIHSNTLSAGYGAAISVWSAGASLTIENSTLHGNTSSGYGTCIYIQEGGDLNISNSTIYNNNGSFTGQAIYAKGSDVILTNVTIAGHTTGSSAIDIKDYEDFMTPSNNKSASISIVNCIIDNSINNYSFFSMMGGTETSLGYNISNDNTMTGVLSQTGDLNNTSSLLDPNGLQNNGGTTPTIRLECGSPAIDAGTLVLTLDQIDSVRYGSGPDIGAFESNKTIIDITTSTSGASITANNTGATYQWLDCDNNYSLIASETSQSFTATANGNYAVQLTENGCVDTSACVNISTLGVIENNFGNSLSVYPNPTSGNFSIDLGDSYDKSVISISDITGRLLESKTITQSEILNLSINEPAGIYFITIQAGDKKAVIRLVKE